MEKSDPALVPEWLRSTGSVSGGGSSAPHSSSSSSHSDVTSLAHHSKNRNPKKTIDFDSRKPGFLDHTSSSNSRRGSSYGSAKHAHSSFSKNWDKDRERDKERSIFTEPWDCDGYESLGKFNSKGDNAFRRSQSMVSRKTSDILTKRIAGESKNISGSHYNNGNGMPSSVNVSNDIPKTVFEKDFPTLGTEEKQGIPDIGRVSSPGLSSAVQSLPIGNATMIGGEGWTSALADVPAIVGSSAIGTTAAAQTVTVGSVSGTSSPVALAGMSMAGALQTPSRMRATPQLSVQTQRREELAIKQSLQLIPMTPSMPKGSILSSDKSKPKLLSRASEMIMTPKSGLHPISPLHHVNQSLHGVHVKSDVPKTSQGKLCVLKPGWENGLSPSTKDTGLATNANGRVANTQAAATPLIASSSLRSPNNSKLPTGDRKSNSVNLISGLSGEKRHLPQSRHDFLKGLKMKTSGNTSAVLPDSPTVDTSPVEKPCEITKDVGSAPETPHAADNGAEVTSKSDTCSEVQRFSDVGEKNMSPHGVVVDSVEEEIEFLRSLGWEEDSDDDEGLTEEEINAFNEQLNEYMKSNPSFKFFRGLQPKIPESLTISVGKASSELSSADSESED